MNYSELREHLKKIKLQELRIDSPELFEFVVRKDQLTDVYPILQMYFGPPCDYAKSWPTPKAQKHVSMHGGVRNKQTLYYLEHDHSFQCALIWPWEDQMSVTVKIIEDQKLK